MYRPRHGWNLRCRKEDEQRCGMSKKKIASSTQIILNWLPDTLSEFVREVVHIDWGIERRESETSEKGKAAVSILGIICICMYMCTSVLYNVCAYQKND